MGTHSPHPQHAGSQLPFPGICFWGSTCPGLPGDLGAGIQMRNHVQEDRWGWGGVMSSCRGCPGSPPSSGLENGGGVRRDGGRRRSSGGSLDSSGGRGGLPRREGTLRLAWGWALGPSSPGAQKSLQPCTRMLTPHICMPLHTTWMDPRLLPNPGY